MAFPGGISGEVGVEEARLAALEAGQAEIMRLLRNLQGHRQERAGDEESQGSPRGGQARPVSTTRDLVAGRGALLTPVSVVIPDDDVPLPPDQVQVDAGREFKPDKSPRLGKNREKGEMAYGTWKPAMILTLRQAGLLPVLQHTPPEEDSDPALKLWYTNASAAALSGLISAVQHLPLVAEIYRCVEHPWGARVAWFLIKDRYLSKTSLSVISLSKRLSSFAPFPGENMNAFLQRAQDLKDSWADYDLELEDSKLVTQIMTSLPYSWWTQLQLNQESLSSITFQELCTRLRKENSAREAAPANTSQEY